VGSVTPRPRLLLLCQTLPFPPDGGVWIRTYHVLRLLAQTFDVTALCFERSTSAEGGTDVATAREALERFAAVEVFPIPQRHSRLRYAWDHLRSAVRRQVYTNYLYGSRPFRRRLADLLKEQSFDLVHVDSLDLAGYLPMCAGVPVVCVHHNVESALLQRRATIERPGWRSRYLGYQARLTEETERRWCERVALNVMVSEEDRRSLQGIAPESRITVVPNGVDVEEFRPEGTDGSGIAFMGGITWFPNRDALEFYCADILPHLKAAGRDVRTRWVGAATPEQRRWYGEEHGLELTGHVADVRPWMQEAACHVVPLRAGGGTRLKILNSWAMGKAVVSTSVGCEGLATIEGENILIRDDPKDFAQAILAVLADPGLRRRLGEGGRATAERLYSWDVIGQHMIETYLSVATAPSRELAIAAGAIRADPGYSS
jgi:glycosyltransferase involved in cell wall biosynthesis